MATLLDARVMFEWFQFDPVWTGWIGCRETVSMPGISPLIARLGDGMVLELVYR